MTNKSGKPKGRFTFATDCGGQCDVCEGVGHNQCKDQYDQWLREALPKEKEGYMSTGIGYCPLTSHDKVYNQALADVKEALGIQKDNYGDRSTFEPFGPGY